MFSRSLIFKTKVLTEFGKRDRLKVKQVN